MRKHGLPMTSRASLGATVFVATAVGTCPVAAQQTPAGGPASTSTLPAGQQAPVATEGVPAPAVNLNDGTAPLPGTSLLLDIPAVIQRLDAARAQIEPDTGATKYDFSAGAIGTLPQGDNIPLDQVLVQAPGVALDSFGQIHVRGDHNEIQFRLDGVQLPEGLSVFGQALETRFAHSIALITGALPAEYGFDTAAVIDITTKSGTTDPGGDVLIYGGARDYLQPSFSYGGRSGAFDYFVTGDFLHTRVGIENPTGSFDAVHDLSNQTHGLAHISAVVDPTTRVSLLAGVSNDFFQIPDNPGQTPSFSLSPSGQTPFNSADLNENQREITDFVILSVQKQFSTVDLQSSVFSRYSSLYYTPDPLGDLLFDGLSQTAARSVWSSGSQSDASWRASDDHTLRAGYQVFVERNVNSTSSVVLPAAGPAAVNQNGAGLAASITPDGGGAANGGPFAIDQGQSKTGTVYGLYLQDEWRILPRVTINYGVRFDGVSEFTSDSQIGPRINVVWRPTKWATLHGGYSRYFIPPPFELVSSTSVDQFNGTSAASQVTLNNKVEPERDNYYDLGAEQIVLPGWRIGEDAYDKDATNLIDEGQFGAPIILTAFNYAKGEVHGYELTSSYDRGPVSLYGNVALSRAIGKDIDSAQFNFSAADLAYISQHWIHLDHDQRWTGSGGAAYTLFRESQPLRLSTDLVVGSGLRADGTVPNGRALPGYYEFNLAAVETLNLGFGKATQLRFDVINLLDRVYEIRDGTGVGVGAPQFGLRRTILAGIAQKF